jgi:long-chain acyl-CoA synthetase
MDVKRIFDIAAHAAANYSQDDCLAVKRNGKWDKFSTAQYIENANYISYALLELGFKKDDKIASVSNNRPEWNFLDLGMSQVGVVHIPIYPTVGRDEYEHILSHSSAKILVISSKERYEMIKPIADKIINIEKVYTFEKIEGVPNFEDLIELGKQNAEKYKQKLEEVKASINENEVCSIIYTSGTTGLSKGVMMTHKNFVSNVLDTQNIIPKFAKMALSFLPLNHVFERMLNYLYQYAGIKIYYAESTDTVVDNLKDIKPDFFASVPRVLEKVYDKIYGAGMGLTGIKKAIFFWALDLAIHYDPTKNQGAFYNFKLKIADKLIFVKWRAALGGNVKFIVSGGAALQPRLSKVFGAAKIQVMEGYGLTETAPVISVNKYNEVRPGTVGPILDSADVKIADDGEILFKGPNLMPGYYKDTERTAEVINAEGYFHTGDLGKLEGKILSITGRKKELFKLSTGKYVAPQPIENKFKESPFIEQLMVVGDGEKYCAAIIAPVFEYLHNWASLHHVVFRSNLDLVKNPKVVARIQKEVDRYNKRFDQHMQIKKFALTCQEWTPDTGDLSPTLKVKRNFLMQKYQMKIEFLYGRTAEEKFLCDD